MRWKIVKFLHIPGIEPRFLKLPVRSHFPGSRATKVITGVFVETLGKHRHGLKPHHASWHSRPSAKAPGQEISCSSSLVFPVLFVCKPIEKPRRRFHLQVAPDWKLLHARIRSYTVYFQSNIIVEIVLGLRWSSFPGGTEGGGGSKMNLFIQCKSRGSN